jgi:hypothetical protein
MIVPWPCMSRGTECTVPMVPGLVSEIVVPAKSSTPSLPPRARRTTSSYAFQNCAKSSVSACLMLGTRSWRVPSGFARSIARPRLTCAGVRTAGLPSTSVYALFIAGISPSASTSAKPMRCVNETLPPRPRARWLLMTMRLSTRSLAGIARTDVAVGTSRLASMLVTTRAAGPRRRWVSSGTSGTSCSASRAAFAAGA